MLFSCKSFQKDAINDFLGLMRFFVILLSRPTTRIEVFMFRLDIVQGIQSVPVLSVEFSIVCHGQIYGIVYPPLSLFI